MEKQIIIRPVVKPKFSGVSKHAKTVTVLTGAQMGTTTGLYKTGLTTDEETKYELELNLPKGTLGKRSSFWGELEIRLFNDKPTYFSIVSPMDEIKAKVIYEHSAIANNELELSKNSLAEFYIEDLEAKAKLEEVKIDLTYEANQALMDTTTDEKRGYLRLYDGKKGIANLSERVVKTELFKKVNADPKRFLDYVNNPDISTMIMIEELMESGAVTRKGSYYMYEKEVIGSSIEAAIAFFKEAKNQSLKIAMKQSLKNDKKLKD